MNPDITMGSLIGAGIMLFVMAIGLAVYQDHEHTQFLREHGCQLVAKAETGRNVRHGKTYSPEVVKTYECADGIRREFE